MKKNKPRKLNIYEKRITSLLKSTFESFEKYFIQYVSDTKTAPEQYVLRGRHDAVGMSFPLQLTVFYTVFNPDNLYINFDIDYADSIDEEKLKAKLDLTFGYLSKLIELYKLQKSQEVQLLAETKQGE